VGLFSKEKIRKETSKEKVKKMMWGKYDINKQTLYIAPKSKLESRDYHALEPAQGHGA